MEWCFEKDHPDAISRIQWGPSNMLASACWSSEVLIHAPPLRGFLHRIQLQAPVLSVLWSAAGESVYSAGADRRVTQTNLGSLTQSSLGVDFEEAVSCLALDAPNNRLIAGSYDRCIQAIDVRSNEGSMYKQPEKVLALDVTNNLLVAALSSCRVRTWDLRQLADPLETQQIHSEWPLRTLRCMPNGRGFAVSNIQSRVTVSYFRQEEQQQSICFRTNDRKTSSSSAGTVYETYPVYGLAFHPVYEALATGGGDRTVSVWDYSKRRRICKYSPFDYSVLSLDYSLDGKYLACALTDDQWRTKPPMGRLRAAAALAWREVSAVELDCDEAKEQLRSNI